MTSPQPHRSKTGKLRPRARLVRTLGEELISSETVALIELVKNAYDADATRVLVSFHAPLRSGEGGVDVLDDGNGMDLETIENAWLEPATLSKKDRKHSETKQRRMLGEKGIGRFAASKLADELTVISRRRRSTSEVVAEFDWSRFDHPESYLHDIAIKYQERVPEDIAPDGVIAALRDLQCEAPKPKPTHGTILRMRKLRENWPRGKIERMRRGLSRLLSPGKNASDFCIELQVPEPFEDLSGPITPPEILSHPKYMASGQVEADGRYTLKITLPGQKKPIELEGRFGIDDDARRGEDSVNPQGRDPLCGPFEFQFRVWDRDQQDLQSLADELGTTVRSIRQDLDDAAGVNVYRDGFRVLPYGEPGNDWLQLDSRRIQNPSLRLSNNQIIGHVFISADKNHNLKDQTNREGLVEGPARSEFQDILRAILAEVEVLRADQRKQQRTKREGGPGLFDKPDFGEIRAHITKKYPKDERLQSLLERTETEVNKRTEKVQEVLARYRRLATLGQLIDTVLHEGRHPLASVRNQAQAGRRDVQKNESHLGPLSEKFLSRFVKIDKSAELVSSVFNKVEPFGGRKPGRPRDVVLESIIAESFSLFEGEAHERKVNFELPSSETTVRVEPSEIQQVVINLLQNSLYWLTHVKEKDRAVRVEVQRTPGGEIELIFSDSGPGVPDKVRDQIFDPYFTTKPNGVGLGLAIAGDIVTDYYGGNLELMDSGPLPGATFRIILRKRV